MVWLPVNGSRDPATIKPNENEIEPFFIAQYQVTYAQYQVFVDAPDGFNKPEWWRGFPHEYRPQPLEEQRTKAPNNPRDSVSWYQSVAFARWLNHRLRGLELAHPGSETTLIVGKNALVRLPAEWEWQWAAQGGVEERQYPWGDWKPGYANTSEAGLGRAIAVGMYPDGRSTCGALDMAGNLFEWCQNDKENPQIVDGYSNEKGKVLRGGAFLNLLNYAACAPHNYFDLPFNRYINFGLRVVVGPLLRL
jgi:formylglycine-generating enzyme required for sulfatase activity